MQEQNHVATITMLAERFPLTFFVYERRRRPFAVGIHEALVAALDGAVPLPELCAAMRYYTNAIGYLYACKEGAARVDLDGNDAGAVTAQQAKWAIVRIKGRAAHKAAKAKAAQETMAAATPVTVPAAEVPAGPKRLSLSDLKAAALKRKTDVAYAM